MVMSLMVILYFIKPPIYIFPTLPNLMQVNKLGLGEKQEDTS